MTPFVPRLVGSPRFPRLIIVDRSRPGDWYWTGSRWSRRLREALLFADIDDLNRAVAGMYADLLRAQPSGDTDS